MRPEYVSVPANYQVTGVTRYLGNPFIEALPPLEQTKNQILDRIRNTPPPPTRAARKLGELVRIAEVGCINEIVYPFAEYKRAGVNLTTNIREAYVGRNPLSVEDLQRRHAIALQNDGSIPFPKNWISTAKGQSLLGISGSGKTTFATAFALPYLIVIEHTEYNGKPLNVRQIPWVGLRMSHDATLKSLCLQFFSTVDGILKNTTYLRQAESVGSIARMVMLIAKVADAVSIGAIFIDEVQNLKAAVGKNATFVLNLFSEIIERAGVTLVIAGTPAVESVIHENVRNLRKLNSGGESNFVQMRLDDPEFDAFTDLYWDYQYVKNPRPLDTDTRKAWHSAGAGNPAFTALAFMLAQRNEIGGREVIDKDAFDRVAKIDMAILEPAIRALRSGKASKLRDFDDLLFKSGCKELRKLIAWSDGDDDKPANPEEFDEIPPEQNSVTPGQPASAKTTPRLKKPVEPVSLPTENPLIQ